jgi:hypothetical protein
MYRQLNLFDTESCQPKPIDKELGVKICVKCKREKDLSSFRLCRPYKGVISGEYVRSECIKCEKLASRQLTKAKKEAPPKPKACQCCCNVTDHFVLDHDHKTGDFRGWLCRNCNQGIGKLGDNIEGLQKAISYLSKDNV